MMVTRTRRTREFTGPTPHSVAIRARPPNVRPPEHLILERRKKEEALQEYRRNTQYMEFNDLKNEWERFTDRKIKINTVKRKVDGLMQANQFNIEDRRERLRVMLQEEEAGYLAEMEENEETVLERQAKMRSRAKFLKDKRESERLDFVQEKYDQQFRNQCEELRSTLSKRQQDEVCAERLEQLRIKDEMERDRMREEEMYAHLWEQDRLKKADKEEQDAKAAHARNQDVLNVLRMQMAALQEQKEEAKRLKIEEAQLLREQAALRRREEQTAREEKLRMQQETRDMLDMSLRLKMKKKAKLEQEQLAFDLKILEQLLEESRNEAMEMMQRKKELREEDRRYREYLHNLMEEEKVKERELEKLVNQEVEKMWQKRLDQWRLERQARKKLLEDVLRVRAQQIQERLLENERKQIETEKERRELLNTIEENKRLEIEKNQKIWNQNVAYQKDLQDQIQYNRQLAELQRQREEEEFKLGLHSEWEYQQRLKNCLDDPEYDRVHPMRKIMAQRSAQSN